MRQLIFASLLVLVLCSPAQAGILKALTKPIKKTCRICKRLALLPEHLLIAYAEGIAAWYRYEIAE